MNKAWAWIDRIEDNNLSSFIEAPGDYLCQTKKFDYRFVYREKYHQWMAQVSFINSYDEREIIVP